MKNTKFPIGKDNSFLVPIQAFIKTNSGVILALIILCAVLSIATNTFLNVDNLLTVARQVSINTLLAIGMTFVLIIGGIDLSVGSVVACCGVISVMLIEIAGLSVFAAVPIGVFFGAVFGFINGFIVSRTSIPPFIVTLATQTAIRGVCYIVSDGVSIQCQDKIFNTMGNGNIGPIPIPLIIVAVAALVTSLVLNRTVFGRRMYATGGNIEAAQYSGINVKSINLMVYIITGILAGVAGIILASRLFSGQPTAGTAYEADAIAAAVLGGTSFTGGIGTIGGTIFGALVIGVLNNGMNLLKVTFYWQFVVKGIVIILAVYIDTIKKIRSNKAVVRN